MRLGELLLLQASVVLFLEFGSAAGLNEDFWINSGSIIQPSNATAIFGSRASISKDGRTVCVTGGRNTGHRNERPHLSVFRRVSATDKFVQVGSDLQVDYTGADASYDYFGFGHPSVAISGDGRIVAGGVMPRNSSVQYGDPKTPVRGMVRVFRQTQDGLGWQRMGQNDIFGPSENSQAGTTLSLSSDGTMLAVGMPGYNPVPSETEFPGLVRVYKYRPLEDDWKQVGQDLVGRSGSRDCLGVRLALSFDGTSLAVPAAGDSGIQEVLVYKLDPGSGTWIEALPRVQVDVRGFGSFHVSRDFTTLVFTNKTVAHIASGRSSTFLRFPDIASCVLVQGGMVALVLTGQGHIVLFHKRDSTWEQSPWKIDTDLTGPRKMYSPLATMGVSEDETSFFVSRWSFFGTERGYGMVYDLKRATQMESQDVSARTSSIINVGGSVQVDLGLGSNLAGGPSNLSFPVSVVVTNGDLGRLAPVAQSEMVQVVLPISLLEALAGQQNVAVGMSVKVGSPLQGRRRILATSPGLLLVGMNATTGEWVSLQNVSYDSGTRVLSGQAPLDLWAGTSASFLAVPGDFRQVYSVNASTPDASTPAGQNLVGIIFGSVAAAILVMVCCVWKPCIRGFVQSAPAERVQMNGQLNGYKFIRLQAPAGLARKV